MCLGRAARWLPGWAVLPQIGRCFVARSQNLRTPLQAFRAADRVPSVRPERGASAWDCEETNRPGRNGPPVMQGVGQRRIAGARHAVSGGRSSVVTRHPCLVTRARISARLPSPDRGTDRYADPAATPFSVVSVQPPPLLRPIHGTASIANRSRDRSVPTRRGGSCDECHCSADDHRFMEPYGTSVDGGAARVPVRAERGTDRDLADERLDGLSRP